MFLLNKCIPMSTEDAPAAGVLRMSILTAQCCRPCPVSLPLSLHSQSSSMSRHGSTTLCSRGTFSVKLYLNHIHSFRSFMKLRYCGMNFEHNKHKYLPSNAYMDPWIQLKLSSRCGGLSQELFPHPSSSLSNSSSG